MPPIDDSMTVLRYNVRVNVQPLSPRAQATPQAAHRANSVYLAGPVPARQAPSGPVDTFTPSDAPVRAVILDDFTNAERPGVTTHGELVQTELRRNQPESDLSIKREQVTLEGSVDSIAQGKPGALTGYMREQFTSRLDADSDGWAKLLEDESGGRTVIHQSQGASQSRAVETVWGRAQRDVAFRNQVERQLGLDPSTEAQMPVDQKTRLLGALVGQSDGVHRNDPAVRSSIEELRLLQSEAADRGHVHVISAGNQGALGREMQALNVPIPEGFFRNEMVGPDSIVVGGANDGTREAKSGQQARVADLASPNAGAHIAADAVDRPMLVEGQLQHHSGFSYAAPQVSSLVVDMLQADPTLTRDQILTNLRSRAMPIEGQERFIGAGVVAYQ